MQKGRLNNRDLELMNPDNPEESMPNPFKMNRDF